MAFTYSDTLSTDRDMVRFLIGDTDSAYWLFQDEELDALLNEFGADVYKAAGWALRILSQDPDRLMRTKDATAGGFTLLTLQRMYGDRADRWLK